MIHQVAASISDSASYQTTPVQLIPVYCGADEVEAAVDARVDDVPSVQSTLTLQELLKLCVHILHYRLETKRQQS